MAVSAPSAGFLSNAGFVAAHDSLFFFASFTRDEIRAYDLRGRTRWISDRSIKWASTPRVEQTPSGGTLRFSAVNLGIAANEHGVFVLSYADTTEKRLRLDVLDAETGVLLKTALLAQGSWLFSLNERGALWVAPADTLTALATPRARTTLPSFRLATTTGDTFDLASTRGRITLVNFWASWCPPCREEFPLMNRLSRELAMKPFTIVAVNEDVDEKAARNFLRDVPAEFVIPLGRGAMQARVGYRGLPYTVLLNREGQILERYFGFGGPAQFRALRQRIDGAVGEGAPSP